MGVKIIRKEPIGEIPEFEEKKQAPTKKAVHHKKELPKVPKKRAKVKKVHHSAKRKKVKKKMDHSIEEINAKIREVNEVEKNVTYGGAKKPIVGKIIPIKPRKLKREKDIAMDFAIKVQKKFDRLVRASVLFGSQTSGKRSSVVGSDIDIIFIVDDVSLEWDLELVAWYREELAKLISRQPYARELHINTVRLSTWWEDMVHGDPVVINILRYGEALIDYGSFFNPQKAMLLQGKIRSTPEAVHAAISRVPGHLARSQASEMAAIEGVYWAMVDSAQAALMTAGKIPPSPEHIAGMLNETFVQSGMLKGSYVKALRELYSLHRAISHGQVSSMKGQEIDEWQELAEKFLVAMTGIITTLLEKQE